MSKLRSLSYRRRNQLLFVGTVLVFGVAYQVSVRPTVELWRSNEARRTAMQQLQQAPRIIAELQARQQQTQWLMRSFRVDTTTSEGVALNRLTSACSRYGVTVAALLPAERRVQNSYSIETRVVKLRGSFHGLVQAVHALEFQQPIGRLSSVRFAVEEDRKQRRSFLYTYLYVQTIVQEYHGK